MSDSEYEDSIYADEITCPYCSYKFRNSWEFDNDSEEIECQREGCEKTFSMERDIIVTYVTKKLKT